MDVVAALSSGPDGPAVLERMVRSVPLASSIASLPLWPSATITRDKRSPPRVDSMKEKWSSPLTAVVDPPTITLKGKSAGAGVLISRTVGVSKEGAEGGRAEVLPRCSPVGGGAAVVPRLPRLASWRPRALARRS